VAFTVFDIRDETDATGIVFVSRIVKALFWR
jgi:hypothetical protein